MLANLSNGTIFKKAFTNKLVFEQFIQDVLGFKVSVSEIETEKQFEPKVGQIAFELDIFAETTDKRMVIELQKVQYDHTFDRFLHYFLMLLAEQQRNSNTYKIQRTVYLILVMTRPYGIPQDLNGTVLSQEMLVTTLHTEDSGKEQVGLYPHKLIALNPNHKNPNTPQNIRDWLDLIYESINHPETPTINMQNPGIAKAADLIDAEKLSPEERAQQKFDEMERETRELYEQLAEKEGIDKRIKKALSSGKFAIEDIAEMFGVSIEYVLKIKQELENE